MYEFIAEKVYQSQANYRMYIPHSRFNRFVALAPEFWRKGRREVNFKMNKWLRQRQARLLLSYTRALFVVIEVIDCATLLWGIRDARSREALFRISRKF